MLEETVNVIVDNLFIITLVVFVIYFGYEMIRGRGEIKKEDEKLI